jgi:hypothetical protein
VFTEGRRQFGRLGRRWQVVKLILKKEDGVVVYVHVVQDGDQW